MSVVALSSNSNFLFTPDIYEWPQLNELYTSQETKLHQVRANNPCVRAATVPIQRTPVSREDVAATSIFGHIPSTRLITMDTIHANGTRDAVESNSAALDQINDFVGSQPREHGLPETSLLQELSAARSEFVNDASLLNDVVSDVNVDKMSSGENNDIGNSRSVCVRKKKRLKKIRRTSVRKWKPFPISAVGFHSSTFTTFSSTENTTESSELTEETIRTERPESDTATSDGQNEMDDISYFRALGIDVLSFEYSHNESDDLLNWDGVYFSDTSRVTRTPLQKQQSCKPKVTSRLKTQSAQNSQSDASGHKNPARNKDDARSHSLPSPWVTFSKLKKCDRFKLFELECSSSKRVYIRRDKHRRREKAHRAVKSKTSRSVFNNAGRKRLYMHHRLIKINNLDIDFRGSIKSYRIPPMPKTNVALDVAKTVFKADRKPKVSQVSRNDQSAPVQNLNHALDESSAPGHLAGDLASFLISLQHREMTPEDYDMLLRLDDSVKPKTVSQNVLAKLRTETIGNNGPEQGAGDWEPLCTICMDMYVVGQERKFLPCGHDFHSSCIDQWLTNSSLNCPLDGLPIETR